MMGALAEEIKEVSLPLLRKRAEDTILGFAAEDRTSKQLATFDYAIVGFAAESSRCTKWATFNHMNLGQRNVASSTLSGYRNEPDPDEEEDASDKIVVVTPGGYGKADDPVYAEPIGQKSRTEPDPDEASSYTKSSKEPDPDEVSYNKIVSHKSQWELWRSQATSQNGDGNPNTVRDEPDPDEDAICVHKGNKEPEHDEMSNDFDPDEAAFSVHKNEVQDIETPSEEPDPDEDAISVHEGKEPDPAPICNEPDPDEAAVIVHNDEEQHIEKMREEPDPDEAIGFSQESQSFGASWDFVSTQGKWDQEIVLDWGLVAQQANRPDDIATVVWMLFTLLRNVMDRPNPAKFHHLQKVPLFPCASQIELLQFEGAVTVLRAVSFSGENEAEKDTSVI